jgi:leucyl/phenylalanyl-tRNA---protein transferase
MLPWLKDGAGLMPFPPLKKALQEPNGLLAAGGNLSLARLQLAYSQGIFPWFNQDQPILWWSPDPRMVLFTGELHVPRSLDKVVRNRAYEIRINTCFERVMRACAHTPRPGQNGTWVTDDMVHAYVALHRAGWAHSFECWMNDETGTPALAGGLYGVAVGRMFYGESMFAWQPDASKIAFTHTARFLAARQVDMIDCQMYTDHLARFGAREISRDDFVAHLTHATALEPIRDWSTISVVNTLRTPSPDSAHSLAPSGADGRNAVRANTSESA